MATSTIGVRELKNHASEIVQEVKENAAEYIVALARQLEMELVTQDRQQLERGAAVVATRTP
jgi:antitoxin (DNA-binding transcriptional repressor) of toxin-antitoxin stability system